MRLNKIIIFCFLIIVTATSCKKLVEVPEPVKSITTSETFATIPTANAALLAIYSDMSFYNGNDGFSNSGTTIWTGMSADELLAYGYIDDFQVNNVLPTFNFPLNSTYWRPAYEEIYKANAAIE